MYGKHTRPKNLYAKSRFCIHIFETFCPAWCSPPTNNFQRKNRPQAAPPGSCDLRYAHIYCSYSTNYQVIAYHVFGFSTNLKPCHLDETRPHQVRVPRVFALLSACKCMHSDKAHLMRTGLVKMTRLGHSG